LGIFLHVAKEGIMLRNGKSLASLNTYSAPWTVPHWEWQMSNKENFLQFFEYLVHRIDKAFLPGFLKSVAKLICFFFSFLPLRSSERVAEVR
jgi:hypothetical protein